MAETESMILPLLREIRAEMNRRFDGVDEKLGAADERFDRLETIEKRLAALEHGNGGTEP
jgi:hypothetical protein